AGRSVSQPPVGAPLGCASRVGRAGAHVKSVAGKEGRIFFFEKKKQKTFNCFWPASVPAAARQTDARGNAGLPGRHARPCWTARDSRAPPVPVALQSPPRPARIRQSPRLLPWQKNRRAKCTGPWESPAHAAAPAD